MGADVSCYTIYQERIKGFGITDMGAFFFQIDSNLYCYTCYKEEMCRMRFFFELTVTTVMRIASAQFFLIYNTDCKIKKSQMEPNLVNTVNDLTHRLNFEPKIDE